MTTKQKRVTIADVARRAEVAASTVSYVMNHARTAVSISEATRERVRSAARELGYHPNAAARSLSTNRTGHIGFILSDNVTDGLANAYFATIISGAERACRTKGYGLNVSLYNLSNIDAFVFPERVGQRSVDGLLLAGYVERAVVDRFCAFGIPCICVGENVEVAQAVPTVASDFVDGLRQAVRHVAALGHRRIGLPDPITRREQEVCEQLTRRLAETAETAGCRLVHMPRHSVQRDYQSGKELIDAWRDMSLDEKPTVLFDSDQAILAAVQELDRHGLAVPDNLSLVCVSDTRICQYAHPAISAVRQDLVALGDTAAGMLIDHIENDTLLSVETSRNDFPCTFIPRQSAGPVPEGRCADAD